jgi:hypothetical protein
MKKLHSYNFLKTLKTEFIMTSQPEKVVAEHDKVVAGDKKMITGQKTIFIH